jgi:hypothetical protein
MDSALDWTSDDEFAIDGISYVCRGVKVGMKSTEARRSSIPLPSTCPRATAGSAAS